MLNPRPSLTARARSATRPAPAAQKQHRNIASPRSPSAIAQCWGRFVSMRNFWHVEAVAMMMR
eukprot:4630319-Pyramimonas_sp.AAC.1